MNAQGQEIENYNFEEFSESSSSEEEYGSEFSESRSMNDKKNSEKKAGLKFASVPYRVNPETNYSGVSGSNLMPDITNANLTPSH
jgi:hypothetical protein